MSGEGKDIIDVLTNEVEMLKGDLDRKEGEKEFLTSQVYEQNRKLRYYRVLILFFAFLTAFTVLTHFIE